MTNASYPPQLASIHIASDILEYFVRTQAAHARTNLPINGNCPVFRIMRGKRESLRHENEEYDDQRHDCYPYQIYET